MVDERHRDTQHENNRPDHFTPAPASDPTYWQDAQQPAYAAPPSERDPSWNRRNKWIPYRGLEQHGIETTTNTDDYSTTPSDQGGGHEGGIGWSTTDKAVAPWDPHEVPPVNVNIVSTGRSRNEHHRQRVNRIALVAQTPTRVAPRNNERTRLRLACDGGPTYFGTDRDSIAIIGAKLVSAPDTAFTYTDLDVTDEVYCYTNAANVVVHVIDEYLTVDGGDIG